jgi:hypothetical protein
MSSLRMYIHKEGFGYHPLVIRAVVGSRGHWIASFMITRKRRCVMRIVGHLTRE